MINVNPVYARTGLLFVLIVLFGIVAACDNKQTGSANAEREAAMNNVEAMAEEHAGDNANPSEATTGDPQRAVVSERLAYAEVDDELVYGHFAAPSDMIEPLPAVIMIHEWWGLNDNVRKMADLLAGEGYIVLAVDLYAGETANNPEAARLLMTKAVERYTSLEENIRQAYNFVSDVAGAPSVASLGWCFGGGWSLNTAMLLSDDLDAAIIYYGQVTDDDEKLRPITASILGFFGTADRGIPIESVERFEDALERLRKDHEIHVYEGARHAFANPSGNAYNEEYAEDAWTKTLTFLAEKL